MLEFVNPATGRTFGGVAQATAADVERARAELAAAQPDWAARPVRERVRALRQLLGLIIDSVDVISQTINQDTGKSRQDGLIEAFMLVERLSRYLRHAPRWLGPRPAPPSLYFTRRYAVRRRPYGVVAVLAPWNYPFDLLASPALAALLAGNAVLVKPSEVAGATGALFEQLIQNVAELAPYARVLHGDGRVGEMVVRSRPDLIYLTGSVGTARQIAQIAAETLTPALFELGGKDPMIVLADADLEAAAHWGLWGAVYNAGQTCMAIERVYVERPAYDRFVELAVAEAQRQRAGYSPGRDCPFQLGPMSAERQRQLVAAHLEDALAKGARILTGGRFEGPFLEPTVVVDVDHGMQLMREETFGPVMPIMAVKDAAEALRLANDSDYGLSGAVWSQDLGRARRIAEQLEVGAVSINDTLSHFAVPQLPFGGLKQSGNARTHSEQDVLQFSQTQALSSGRPPLPFDIATLMRRPGHYRLGKGLLRLAFGVTPRQRLEPLVEEVGRLRQEKRLAGPAAAAAGLLALAAVLFGVWRARR
ncbi:MAG: aldehyde dehydrogenase family protein [Candidatus Promineifilaceae bacterium]